MKALSPDWAELPAPRVATVVTLRDPSDGSRLDRAVAQGFARGVRQGVPAELTSTPLKAAESALEGPLGSASVEDVLDAVFREFCVGE